MYPLGHDPVFGVACPDESLLARQWSPDVVYPLGHDPTFATAYRAPPDGEQKSPDVVYPLGHDPTFFTGWAGGVCRDDGADPLDATQ